MSVPYYRIELKTWSSLKKWEGLSRGKEKLDFITPYNERHEMKELVEELMDEMDDYLPVSFKTLDTKVRESAIFAFTHYGFYLPKIQPIIKDILKLKNLSRLIKIDKKDVRVVWVHDDGTRVALILLDKEEKNDSRKGK